MNKVIYKGKGWAQDVVDRDVSERKLLIICFLKYNFDV